MDESLAGNKNFLDKRPPVESRYSKPLCLRINGAEMRLPQLVALKTAVMVSVATFSLDAGEAKKAANNLAAPLKVRLLDEEKKPIAKALVGLLAVVRNFNRETGGEWEFVGGVTADAEGVAILRPEPGRPFIYARLAERGLVGIGRFKDKQSNGCIDITMYPECHVLLRVVSSQLERLGRKVDRATVTVESGEKELVRVFPGSDSMAHAFVPPGKFELSCRATGACEVPKSVVVKHGERELDLGTIDLPAQRWVLLEGQRAPEIEDVLGWKNGPPLRLAELRGKVVLLEFWGWWCLPCLERSIPEMFKLQDEFRGKDLVIVGIHCPSGPKDKITSAEKLADKLAPVRQKTWKGRDITFPVALTRPRKGSFCTGGPEWPGSKVCFDYGIDFFPSTVLIDRKGIVVGKFHATKEEDRAKLRKLLQSN
jgi:thiol-disulfide isomerase/thioredoxin